VSAQLLTEQVLASVLPANQKAKFEQMADE
jgi:hypothetical protein